MTWSQSGEGMDDAGKRRIEQEAMLVKAEEPL
jgi:hypothetical protein